MDSSTNDMSYHGMDPDNIKPGHGGGIGYNAENIVRLDVEVSYEYSVTEYFAVYGSIKYLKDKGDAMDPDRPSVVMKEVTEDHFKPMVGAVFRF